MIYLRKANSDLIVHCKCGSGYISAPGQMDCPWCGCGWLFTCIDCRKAFTFAEAVEVDFTLEEMAQRDRTPFARSGTELPAREISDWVEFMRFFLREVE